MHDEDPLPGDLEARLAGLGAVLAASPGVVFAYLFGSVAQGRHGPLSDVDVAVYVDPAHDAIDARLEAIVRTARQLGTDRVDVVVLNTAPTSLLARILTTRKVIADNEPFVRHRFESVEGRKAADFRIFERRLLERRFAHQRARDRDAGGSGAAGE